MLNHLMLDKVLSYAARGWKILPVWGHEEGKCHCSRGSDCPSPGKHPILKDWPAKATDRVDTIREWFEKYVRCNWGAKLGKDSGVIDIEFDDEEGRDIATDLFGSSQTMTYTSGRSTHRFFKWHEDLPQQAVIKLHGLEIRTGGGNKGAMSIIPPSVHPSGVPYHEVAGLGVKDVGVADLPEVFWNLINNAKSNDSEYIVEDGVEEKDELDVDAEVSSGSRNDEMLRFGCSMAKMMNSISTTKEKKMLMSAMSGHNYSKFKPPLDQHELDLVFQSVLKYNTQDEVTEASKSAAYTELGLKVTDTGEWFPGSWYLHIIESDPTTFKLFAPGLKGGYIELDVDGFNNPESVHKAFLECSDAQVVLDDVPLVWRGIWKGTPASKNSAATTGVYSKLMKGAQRFKPPKEETRKYQILSMALGMMCGREYNTDVGDDHQSVYSDGDDGVYAKFDKMLENMQMADKTITRIELSRTLKGVGIKSKSVRYGDGSRDQKRLHHANEESLHKLREECS